MAQIPFREKLFHQPLPGKAHDRLEVVARFAHQNIPGKDQRDVVPVFAEIDLRFDEDGPVLVVRILI